MASWSIFSGVEVSDRAIPQLDYVDSTEKTSGKYGWLMFFLRSTYFFKSLFSQEKNISNVNQWYLISIWTYLRLAMRMWSHHKLLLPTAGGLAERRTYCRPSDVPWMVYGTSSRYGGRNLDYFHGYSHVEICWVPLQKFRYQSYCGWLRNPINHHLGWLKAYEQWDKPIFSWCRISQPSTVWMIHGVPPWLRKPTYQLVINGAVG